MKVALNPPLRHLELADHGDIFLALAHYANKNVDYVEFFRKRAERGCFLIIDNGAYEKLPPLSPDRLVEQAKAIRATEIIAPDMLQDSVATFNSTQSFLSILSGSDRKKFRVMGVPQSRNTEDWIHEYVKMTSLAIDTIGIPKWLGCRDIFLKQLLCSGKLDCRKDHHLLGVNRTDELSQIPRQTVRSVDTKLPILLGANMQSLDSKERPSEEGFFDQRLGTFQLQLVLRNITEFKTICQGL